MMFDFFRKKRITKYTDNASEYLQQTFTPEAPKPEVKPAPKVVTKTTLRTDTDSSGSLPYSNDNIKYQKKKQPPSTDSGVRYSLRGTGKASTDIKYSLSEEDSDTLYSVDDDDKDIRFSLRGGDDTNDELKLDDTFSTSAVATAMRKYNFSTGVDALLRDLDKTTNKTFVDALIAHINKKGLRDSEVYKAAQIDRRLFSKIMSDRQYKPSKDTAIAIARALRLTLSEATDMLSRAGYTFSHSNKKDIIVEYFFRERIYKLDDINEVLYNLGQKIIGR